MPAMQIRHGGSDGDGARCLGDVERDSHVDASPRPWPGRHLELSVKCLEAFAHADEPEPLAADGFDVEANAVVANIQGDDVIHGLAGDDYILGNIGEDWIWGDAGDDVIVGGRGDDSIDAGEGDDVVWGGFEDILTTTLLAGGFVTPPGFDAAEARIAEDSYRGQHMAVLREDGRLLAIQIGDEKLSQQLLERVLR